MTLFFLSLSDPPSKKMKYSVESWVKAVPTNASVSRPMSNANSVKTGKSKSAGTCPSSNRTAPALITSRSHASSSSVLTGAITISSAKAPETVKIK
jgi:hypothetical protein